MIAKKLHSQLLNGIMHAPLSFYDRTPTGRILARFSKDINAVDHDMPEILTLAMYYTSEVISITFENYVVFLKILFPATCKPLKTTIILIIIDIGNDIRH